MNVTDPIADMLTRIRNASRARHAEVLVPASKLKTEMAQILVREGFVASFEETKIRKNMINIYHRISAPLFFCSLEFCVLRYLRNPTYMPHASFYSCCGHLFLETDRRWRTRFLVYNISIQFSCFAFSTLKRALYQILE